MTGDDWIRLVDQLPPYAWVTITGGEPFVFKDFDRVFRHIASKFKCNIITNGILLTEKLIETLLSYPNFKTLSVSVDDIGNRVRDVDPKKWLEAEKMMRYFSERRDALGVSTVLDSKTVVLDSNSSELLDIHKYCVETLKCDTHSFQLLKGSPMQHADYMFAMEEIFKSSQAPTYAKWDVISEQLELVRQYNLANNKTCYLHPKIADLNGPKPLVASALAYINEEKFIFENYTPCKAMWESVHVNVDGHVFPCMAVSVGNVKTTPLKDVIGSETFQQLKCTLKEKGLVEGCNRCGYLRPIEKLL